MKPTEQVAVTKRLFEKELKWAHAHAGKRVRMKLYLVGEEVGEVEGILLVDADGIALIYERDKADIKIRFHPENMTINRSGKATLWL